MPLPDIASFPSAFRVLVVEDEFLIAMERDAILKEGGFEVLGPVSTVQAALRQIRAERPDAAVLDVSLRGEKITPVAAVLLAMNVPFVLASAYIPADLADDPTLASVRNLGKPTSPAVLLNAMHEYRRSATR